MNAINLLSNQIQNDIYALWEYVASQDQETVKNYISKLRNIASLLHIDPVRFEEETGEPFYEPSSDMEWVDDLHEQIVKLNNFYSELYNL